MSTPYRRKSVQLRKHKKILVIKRTISKRKKKLPEVLLVPKKSFRKVGVKTQEHYRRTGREEAKRTYLRKGKLSKENKKLLSYVKKYKAGISKKYLREMIIAMKERGYFSAEINWAKRYSVVGKNVARAVADAKEYVGKRIGKKKQFVKIKRAVKKARLKSYQDILGVTKEKAKKILDIIDKNLPGVNQLKALIY